MLIVVAWTLLALSDALEQDGQQSTRSRNVLGWSADQMQERESTIWWHIWHLMTLAFSTLCCEAQLDIWSAQCVCPPERLGCQQKVDVGVRKKRSLDFLRSFLNQVLPPLNTLPTKPMLAWKKTYRGQKIVEKENSMDEDDVVNVVKVI